MTATTPVQPDSGTTTTGADSATSQTKPARRSGNTAVILMITLVLLIGGIIGYALGSANANSSKTSEIRELRRATAQRELTAYAADKNLEVTNITVSYEGNTLMASWTQGDQTCTAPAVVKDSKSFYSALAVKQGSGSCITKTASDGIGGGSGG